MGATGVGDTPGGIGVGGGSGVAGGTGEGGGRDSTPNWQFIITKDRKRRTKKTPVLTPFRLVPAVSSLNPIDEKVIVLPIFRICNTHLSHVRYSTATRLALYSRLAQISAVGGQSVHLCSLTA